MRFSRPDRCRRLALTTAAAATVALAGAPPAAAVETALVLRLKDSRITESSGLARSGYDDRVLWTHNDSGDRPRLYAVDASTGRTRATVALGGVQARDWEAMARYRSSSGTSYLYVGDIGDNARARSEIAVHVLTEPRSLYDRTVTPTTHRLRYPDGAHDAEALLVDPHTRRLYVVTKEASGAGVYAAPSVLPTSGVTTLRRVASAPPRVTDGAFLWDGRVVLRDYSRLYVANGVGGATRTVTSPRLAQAESLAPAPGYQAVYVGSEGLDSPVYRQPIG